MAVQDSVQPAGGYCVDAVQGVELVQISVTVVVASGAASAFNGE